MGRFFAFSQFCTAFHLWPKVSKVLMYLEFMVRWLFVCLDTVDHANHLSQVSLSSMEASVVPDTTMTDISNCRIRPAKGTIDLFSGAPIQMAAQFTPMDREARVLRYREKKKARKFEKMIRYASRKAYAETRPRIKGRFAKRSEVKLKVADQTFSASMVSESSYGIVPSF